MHCTHHFTCRNGSSEKCKNSLKKENVKQEKVIQDMLMSRRAN